MIDAYLVYDFETTGLDPQADRIIQVGVVGVTGGQIVEQDKWLVNQGVRIAQEAQAKHQISYEMTLGGLSPADSVKRLLDYMGRYSNCMGHNIHRFDVLFLQNECRRLGIPMPVVEHHIDTAAYYKGRKIGMRREGSESERAFANRVLSVRAFGVKYSIATCLEEMGISLDSGGLHDACNDAIATHHIYRAMRV